MSPPLPEPEPGRPRRSRREALQAVAAVVLAGGLSKGGCAQAPSRPEPVDVAAADLSHGRRVVVQYAGEPVEVRRSAAGAVARVLVCTHYGCTVAWREEAEAYVCPCHAGRFDGDGVPVMGPPQRPLRTVPVALVGDGVRVGG